MDTTLAEADDTGRSVAYNRVAGVVMTRNEPHNLHAVARAMDSPPIAASLTWPEGSARTSRGRTGAWSR
jgi:hypothetical protein